MQEHHYLVPRKSGATKDLECSMKADSIEEAEYAFVDAKDRLLDINSWNKYCPALDTEFRLTDIHGLGVGRHARKGDLVRMDIPNQLAVVRGGFCWLSIAAIAYDDYPDLNMELFAVRFQSRHSPLLQPDMEEQVEDTFTLVVERIGSHIHGFYHSRAGDEAVNSVWLQLPGEMWNCLLNRIVMG